MYGIYINLGSRLEFRTQKLPYERISVNFSDFIDFGHQAAYAKKDHSSILAVFQNIWDLHKFGLQIECRTQKLPYKRISGNFFDFIDFGHQVRVCEIDHFSILAVIINIWNLHIFGLQIWIQNVKITPWKNLGQFFRLHQFWSKCMRKRPVFNISCISKCMGFT